LPNPVAEQHFAEGVAHHRQGRHAEAGAAYARACEADPSHIAARFNLAFALQQQGRDLDAESAYKQVLARKPDLVQAHTNLANLYLAHGRVAEALELLMRATKVAPAFAPPWNGLGNALLAMGRTEEAREHFQKALDCDPSLIEARINLGRTLQTLGRPAQALPHLEQALAARPDDAELRFMRDAVAGARPPRPPEAFVGHLFDDMAATFDEHLVEKLGYRIPPRIAEVAGAWLDGRPRPRVILDLGCGTGLVGDALRGRFESLHGVDLAPKMVALAKARRLYAGVETGDLVAWLGMRPAAEACFIVAADVFVYLGDLAPTFAAASRALAPGGRFAFSVEGGGPGGDFALDPLGRYSHGDGYVRATASAHAMSVVHASPETIRAERGVPVPGRLYVLERATA
jgi:predicted TPR repeat methyltransferase